MEDQTVVVAVLAVREEVLCGLGDFFGEDADEDVAHRRAEDYLRGELARFGGVERDEVFFERLLVEDVSRDHFVLQLHGLSLREDEEPLGHRGVPGLFVRGREDAGVELFLLGRRAAFAGLSGGVGHGSALEEVQADEPFVALFFADDVDGFCFEEVVDDDAEERGTEEQDLELVEAGAEVQQVVGQLVHVSLDDHLLVVVRAVQPEVELALDGAAGLQLLELLRDGVLRRDSGLWS